MRAAETVSAHGHERILATNKTTFEITKDKSLTEQGDCIIALGANKSTIDLKGKFKEIIKKKEAKLTICIQADGEEEIIEAWGSPSLTLNHHSDLVIRKSNYVCDRTLAIKANKAAQDFSRNLIKKLQNSEQEVSILLFVEEIK
ncbi:MAG: DUF371 domain-containing protein [Candidatus Bathyarchaeota archaeon]|nr:MAG: DUF371 domain-containing protein [Candidatus Bathyarchaeota archaeon]